MNRYFLGRQPVWDFLRNGFGREQKDLISGLSYVGNGVRLSQVRGICVLLLELWVCPERRAYLASMLADRYGKIT